MPTKIIYVFSIRRLMKVMGVLTVLAIISVFPLLLIAKKKHKNELQELGGKLNGNVQEITYAKNQILAKGELDFNTSRMFAMAYDSASLEEKKALTEAFIEITDSLNIEAYQYVEIVDQISRLQQSNDVELNEMATKVMGY